MTSAHEFAQDGSAVNLTDETGRSLPCQIEQTFEIEDEAFALLLPIDTPIEVFAWSSEEGSEDDEETLVDVEDEEIEAIFPTAQAVLAEQNLTLKRTAVTLTVAGEIPEADEEDCFTLEINDLLHQAEEEATSEDFQILATFFHDQVEFTACTPVDPLLIFARLRSDGTAQVVPPEEFEQLRPELETALFEVLD